MKKIWKYASKEREFKLDLPASAVIRLFDMQYSRFCIWAEFDTIKLGTEARSFKIFETGDEIPDNAEYIQSFQHDGYVWHLHEMK